MRTAECINLVFFSFFVIVSWLRRLSSRRRIAIIAIGITGISLVMAAQFADHFFPPLAVSVARDWLPAALMPMVYWQTGRFSRGVNESFQKRLQRLDDRLLSG